MASLKTRCMHVISFNAALFENPRAGLGGLGQCGVGLRCGVLRYGLAHFYSSVMLKTASGATLTDTSAMGVSTSTRLLQ